MSLGEISIGRFTTKKYYHLVMKTQWMEMFIHHIEEPCFVLLKFFHLKFSSYLKLFVHRFNDKIIQEKSLGLAVSNGLPPAPRYHHSAVVHGSSIYISAVLFSIN